MDDEPPRQAEASRDSDFTLSIDDVAAPITASFGIASATGAETNWREVFVRADKALYAAKARGRNRVEQWSEGLDQEQAA